MTPESNGDARRAPASALPEGRRPWRTPTLTAYGPIGKLTQGGTGARSDGTAGKRR